MEYTSIKKHHMPYDIKAFYKLKLYTGSDNYKYSILCPKGRLVYSSYEKIKDYSKSMLAHTGLFVALQVAYQNDIKNLIIENADVFNRTNLVKTDLVIQIDEFLENFDTVLLEKEKKSKQYSRWFHKICFLFR